MLMSVMTPNSIVAVKMQLVKMVLGTTAVSAMKVMKEMDSPALVSVLKNNCNILTTILKVKWLSSC